MILTCGIDPGHLGAVALLDECSAFLRALDLPRDPRRLWEKLTVPLPPLTEIHVALEEPFAFAGQGHNPAEQFRNFGQVEGVLACTGLPVTTVAASSWKAAMGLTLSKADSEGLSDGERKALRKQRSRDRARCLWPDAPLSTKRGVVKESWAEAALLARWLWERERQGRMGL